MLIRSFAHRIFRPGAVLALAGMALATAAPAQADGFASVESAFDRTFGTETRAPRTFDTPLEARLVAVANAAQGRIGVAAMDLATGHTVHVLGDQYFPMASTSKIAIAATFLEGVDQGRWSLSSEFPLLIPVKSAPFSSAVAPVRKGNYLPARELIDLMITRSSNPATDALLAVIGGPQAVNAWARRAGIQDFHLDRDIATLGRDGGAVDPAVVIERRDAVTPLAMLHMLRGLHEGKWLSASSRRVLLEAMDRTVTGKRRIRALMPEGVQVGNKTGSLNNTTSHVGYIRGPDGRTIALAIYVTGQGGRLNREQRVATIARTLFDGYQASPAAYQLSAVR